MPWRSIIYMLSVRITVPFLSVLQRVLAGDFPDRLRARYRGLFRVTASTATYEPHCTAL